MDNASAYAHTQLATNAATYTAGLTWYVALFTDTADPSLSGTEFSMGGYARKAVTFTASGQSITNSGTVSWTGLGNATWGGTAVFDAATGGNCWFFEDYSPRVAVTSGAQPQFTPGQLEVDFS